MSKVKLYCLAHAGGSATVAYSKWKRLFSNCIEICPIDLKGRGRRFNEPFYPSLSDAVDDIFSIIEKSIYQDQFAFFGHSYCKF